MVAIRSRISVLGCVLGVVHLAFVLLIYSQHYEGGWSYWPVAVIDFPVTLILAAGKSIIELQSWWLAYVLLGSAWWYVVGHLIAQIYKRMQNSKRH